ncbi:MAG: SNF2-related protein [Eubacterium sp.]|nr:SNF2-related protein [Eubacterium sp.]
MLKLWNHQKYAIDKYKGRKFFGLLFDMGLGKTLTTIKLAEEKERPVLIIAPNALCQQWKDEIDKYKEKDWNVLICTSKTRHNKKFKEALEELCEE